MRVEPSDLNPQTSRSSSSFVNTRVGEDASVRSSANSFAASSTRCPRTVAARAAGSISSVPTRSRPRPIRGPRAAQHGRDPQSQLAVRERLGDVVVRAALEPADAVELAGAARQDDERQRRVQPRDDPVRLAHAPDQVQAGAVGQPDVDDGEVRARELEQAARASSTESVTSSS